MAAGQSAKVDAGDTAWVLASTALVMLITPALGLFYAGMVRQKNVLATIMHSFFLIALISGAFAERVRFRSYVIFTLLWSTLVYCPVAHWVWAPGGWLREMGALDFAGGIVVHVSSGIAALACAVLIGRRNGHGGEEFMPHNVTMTVLGAGLLWFGWFGFNAGSALGAGSLATSAFVVANAAAATGTLAWALIKSIHRGKLGYDDSLDVFGVHGVGGVWGVLAVGLFASKLVNPAGNDGLFFGNAGLFVTQLKAVVAVGAYSFVVTAILLKVLGAISPMRVSKEDEDIGLDLSQHGEFGYHTA